MGETLPTEPQAARPAGSGKVAAIVGIVLGFIAYIVPGIFSLRSYRRWKRGEIRRPMFAWTTAAIVGPLLVLSAVAFFLLYTLPLVADDFSDPTSGWHTERPPSFADRMPGVAQPGAVVVAVEVPCSWICRPAAFSCSTIAL